jgi:outer membrane protein TolC
MQAGPCSTDFLLTGLGRTVFVGGSGVTRRDSGRGYWNFHGIHPFLLAFLALTLVLPLPVFSSHLLDLDSVTNKALQHAYDIRISKMDVEIAAAQSKEARSLYFPSLNAAWNAGYLNTLGREALQVAEGGNTVLVENRLFQNSFSLGATYRLFDFGARGRKVAMADRERDIRRLAHARSVREVKLKVLGLYADLSSRWKEVEWRKALIPLQKELALATERLFGAGLVAQTEVGMEALKMVRTVDDLDRARLGLTGGLQELSLFTGEAYNPDTVVIADMACGEAKEEKGFDARALPEVRILDLEIEKKRMELEVLERERLPQVNLSSQYLWYGYDRTGYDASLREVRPQNLSVGVSAVLPLFDGFKTSARVERVKLEAERLKLERERKLGELTKRQEYLLSAREVSAKSAESHREMFAKAGSTLSMVERLTDQKVVEWREMLRQRVDLLNERFELEKALIARASAVRELRILSEGVD